MAVTALDPMARPQVGDDIYMGNCTSRLIVEILGEMDDGRWKYVTLDEKSGITFRTAIRLPDGPEPKGEAKRAAAGIEKPRMTPELRQAVHDGTKCRARGHDLTGTLPNGKAALYISPKGVQSCRWCKAEAAERHAAKVAAK